MLAVQPVHCAVAVEEKELNNTIKKATVLPSERE
jgi:hypothetical protein